MRRIAETAGVDQALVHHFYGTKEKLFLNALEIPLRMPEALAEAALGDRVGLGSRIALAHLQLWEDASARPATMTTLRSAATHRSAAAVLRDSATGTTREALGKAITGETPNSGSP
ncbi:TetR/AcrR family transcriptional regulator [Streptomyces albidoflavus]